MHGFQIWVNLPRKDKLMKPRYQELPNAGIPVAVSADGKVKVKSRGGRVPGPEPRPSTPAPPSLSCT